MISHSAGLMCVRSGDEFSLHLNLIVYCIACELPNKQHAGDKLIAYYTFGETLAKFCSLRMTI